jgi:WD40 repeat protein
VLRLLDVATGNFVFEYPRVNATGAAFSPDGSRLVAGKEERVVWLDASNGQVLHEFRGHADFVRSVAYSRDGKWLVSCSMDRTVRVWDVESKAQVMLFSIAEGLPTAVCLSGDKRRLVLGTDLGMVHIWDLKNDSLVREFKAHQDQIRGLRYSDAGDFFLSGSMDSTVKWWDATSGALLHSFEGHSFPVLSVDLSRDSRFALSGSSDKSMRVWNPTTGKEILPPRGHTEEVLCAALSGDGLMASGGQDKTLRIWSMEDDVEEKCWKTSEGVYAVAFAPDGERIAYANFERIAVLNRRTGAVLQQWNAHAGRIRWIEFSPDGRHLYSAGWDAKLAKWRVEDASRVFAVETGSAVQSALLWNAGVVFCGDWRGNISVWNADTGERTYSFAAHEQVVSDLVPLGDGKCLVSSGDDRKCRVWDTDGFRPVHSMDTETVQKMAVFPRRSLLALATKGHAIEFWSLRDWQKVHTVEQDTRPQCILAACGEDGLVSANADGTIYLYRFRD